MSVRFLPREWTVQGRHARNVPRDPGLLKAADGKGVSGQSGIGNVGGAGSRQSEVANGGFELQNRWRAMREDE
jgi:hypothetical protein